jgi:hypothetical protein
MQCAVLWAPAPTSSTSPPGTGLRGASAQRKQQHAAAATASAPAPTRVRTKGIWVSRQKPSQQATGPSWATSALASCTVSRVTSTPLSSEGRSLRAGQAHTHWLGRRVGAPAAVVGVLRARAAAPSEVARAQRRGHYAQQHAAAVSDCLPHQPTKAQLCCSLAGGHVRLSVRRSVRS